MPPRDAGNGSRGTSLTATGFVTQGQVDWVAFGNTVVSASLTVFQRLSGAGVQPVTQYACIALAIRLRLGQNGRQRIEEALQRVSGTFSYDQVLYFGFGSQSLIRILQETESGFNLIALCTCLTDTHSEAMSARILGALWDIENYPAEYKPSQSQFIRVLKACSGISLVTTFGSTVDIMLGDLQSQNRGDAREMSIPMAAATEDVARVIQALFRLSRGELEHIEVFGGPEAAFIAALSSWLFDFNVEVRDVDGEVVFTNVGNGQSKQVAIHYVNQATMDAVQLRSTTFVLGRNEDIFVESSNSHMIHLLIRTPWSNCLKRVFGSTFTACVGFSRQLGAFLGSAARIYSALARSELKVSSWSRQRYINFLPSSYGLGFVNTVFEVLPELSDVNGLEDIMRQSAEASFEEAIRDLDVSIHDLRKLCSCDLCTRQGRVTMLSLTSRRCSIVMARTIRQIALTMSSASIEGNILPTVSGLESIYDYNAYLWSQPLVSRQDEISSALDLESLVDGQEPLEPINSALRTGAPLQLTSPLEEIFLGRNPSNEVQDHEQSQLAFAHSGVCIYIQALRGISCKAELMRRVHVLPGHIQHGTRYYDRILDGSKSSGNDINRLDPVSYHVSDSTFHKPVLPFSNIGLKALVNEPLSGNDAIFYYKVTLPNGVIHLQPGGITEQVLTSSGTLYCDPKYHNGDSLSHPSAVVVSGWRLDERIVQNLPYRFGIAYCLWMHTDDVLQCVVLECLRNRPREAIQSAEELVRSHGQQYDRAGQRASQHSHTIYIRRGQCFACSAAAIQNCEGSTHHASDKVVAHII